MTDVAVTGATGRMGTAVIEAAADREDAAVAFAVNRDPDLEAVAGIPVRSAGEFAALLAEHDSDAVVDFTGPDSTVAYAEACATEGVPLVTGSTGLSEGHLEDLRAASAEVPVLKAANFARGVHALVGAIHEALETVPGYDLELVETHHNGKVDAPSGTANTILDAVRDHRDVEPVYGREGHAPREDDEIAVFARRAGDVRGEHELVAAGNDEVLSLSHRAEDRGVFAAGALDAAVWLAGRDPGWYDFGDVIGED